MKLVQAKVTVKVLKSDNGTWYTIKSRAGKVLHVGSKSHIFRMLKRYA